jgi:hypothetical protein
MNCRAFATAEDAYQAFHGLSHQQNALELDHSVTQFAT